MTPLAGPLHAAALVLVLAGVAKWIRPGTTAAALRTVGLPASRPAVRAVAAVELAVAATVLTGTAGAAAPLALGMVHLGFAGVAARLWRQAADCGCFGRGAPVTGTHLATNVAVAAIALTVAVDGRVASVGAAAGATPGAGVPYLLLVAVLAAGEVLCLTALADLRAAARDVADRAGAAA